jgi:hypothetical protein
MFTAKPKIEFAIHGSSIAMRLFHGLSPVTVSADSQADPQAAATTSKINHDIASGLSGRDIEQTNLTGVLRSFEFYCPTL